MREVIITIHLKELPSRMGISNLCDWESTTTLEIPDLIKGQLGGHWSPDLRGALSNAKRDIPRYVEIDRVLESGDAKDLLIYAQK